MGHTSTSFPEDTKDLVSVLHRVRGDGGAYGGEETVQHNGARVVFLSVSPSSPSLVHNLDLFGSLHIGSWLPFYHRPTLSLFFQWLPPHYFWVSSLTKNVADS